MWIEQENRESGEGQSVVKVALLFNEQGDQKDGSHDGGANQRHAAAGDKHEHEREGYGDEGGIAGIAP